MALTTMCEHAKRERASISWGTYNFCGSGETTWFGLAQAAIDEARLFREFKVKRIIPISTDYYPTPALRPKYSVLDCSKIRNAFGVISPFWQESLKTCIQELYACQTTNPIIS